MTWTDRDLVRKGYPDFTIFYSAGTMVQSGMAASLYDERAEFQTQRQFAPEVSTRHGALPYNHPPFEAVLFVPLSFLAYLPAYLTWDAVNLGLLVLALLLLRRHVPICQHDEFFANAVRLFEIVAHEQCRSAVASERFAELALESAAQMRVQRGKWLVEQQRGRLDGASARERDALLFAAGKRCGVAASQTVEMRGGKLFRDAPISICVGKAPQSERDIFRHGQVRDDAQFLVNRGDPD